MFSIAAPDRRTLRWILAWLIVLQPTLSAAQITLDGSLGRTGSPPKSGAAYTIGAGLGQRRGANLFHSFEQFNVRTGESATFTGPGVVQNIIGRVTGGSSSLIDGLLRSTIPGANLYLLNPRGVVFGPGASLDIRGSFHVSTGDYLRLADGGLFQASLARPSNLTVAPPVAFGFLGGNPAPITISGSTLQVPDGRTLSVVGGDILVSGATLAALGGRVNLAAVGSVGEVVAASGEPTLSPEGFARLGHVDIVGSLVDVSGDGGGTVAIRAGSLVMDSSVMFADTHGDLDGAALGIDITLSGDLRVGNSVLTTDAFGAGRPGNIAISTDSLELTDGSFIASRAITGPGGNIGLSVAGGALIDGGATIQASTQGAGPGGTIVIDSGSLAVRDGSQISSQTSGTGPGGSVSVAARELLTIEGAGSAIFSLTEGAGPGGAIRIAARTVTIDHGGVATLGFGAGRTGDVTVEGGTLTLTGGGFVSSNAEGTGQGGLVTISTTDSVSISGRDADGAPSGLFTASLAGGAAGGIRVSTPSLTLADGAGIQVENLGTGRAGDLTIEVGRLSITGGSDISSTTGAGRGGDVVVIARESVSIVGQAPFKSDIVTLALGDGDSGRVLVRTPTLTLGDEGSIVAQTQGQGRAGAVVLEVDRLTATGGAVIAGNTAGSGDAGGVSITATGPVTLTGGTPNGGTGFLGLPTIASGQAGQGTGAPGPIEIVTPHLTLSSAAIAASTGGSAPAGEIRLDVGRLSLTDGARIESRATSAGGSGRVIVNASESVELTSGGRSPGGNLTAIVVTTEGTGPGGEVVIRTPRLTLDNSFITGNAFGTGRGADVSIQVGTLTISGGGQIASGSRGAGSGGNITVSASDAVAISGGIAEALRSGLLTSASASGAAGNVTVVTPTLTLADAGVIAAQTFGSGGGGAIDLRVGRLDITGGSRVDTSTFGPGAGGTVTIAASEAISISGASADGRPSGMFSATTGLGAAGRLEASAPALVLDGASIGAATENQGPAGDVVLRVGALSMSGAALIETTSKGTTLGSGQAGNVTLEVGTVSMTGGAQIASSSLGPGAGGTIVVNATQTIGVTGAVISTASSGAGAGGDIALSAPRVELTDGAEISSSSVGSGNAGRIAIRARDAFVSRSSAVTTETTAADGGDILLLVGGLLHLVDSRIEATVRGGQGAGGNIVIGGTGVGLLPDAIVRGIGGAPDSDSELTPRLIVLDGSQIRADAFGGPGGNVQIAAEVLLSSGSTVSASSALGLPGSVDIRAAITDVSGSLARLPEAVLQGATLLRESCGARFAEHKSSSLALGARDGVPVEPGSVVGSPLLSLELGGAAVAMVAPRVPVIELRCAR